MTTDFIVKAFRESASVHSQPEWVLVAIAILITLMDLWLLIHYLESDPPHPGIPGPDMPIFVEENDE